MTLFSRNRCTNIYKPAKLQRNSMCFKSQQVVWSHPTENTRLFSLKRTDLHRTGPYVGSFIIQTGSDCHSQRANPHKTLTRDVGWAKNQMSYGHVYIVCFVFLVPNAISAKTRRKRTLASLMCVASCGRASPA